MLGDPPRFQDISTLVLWWPRHLRHSASNEQLLSNDASSSNSSSDIPLVDLSRGDDVEGAQGQGEKEEGAQAEVSIIQRDDTTWSREEEHIKGEAAPSCGKLWLWAGSGSLCALLISLIVVFR